MALVVFLLLFLSFEGTSSWECPTDPLGGKEPDGSFPDDGDGGIYAPGTTCNITIVSLHGHYTHLAFDISLGQGDSCKVTDDLGTNFVYYKYGQTSNFHSAQNFIIRLASAAVGTLSFKWTYYPLAVNNKSILPLKGVATFTLKEIIAGAKIIQCKVPVAILGSVQWAQNNNISAAAQSCFIFAGDGVDGQLLGTLYTIGRARQPLIYSTAPYTVTLVCYCNPDAAFAAFLVRPAAEIPPVTRYSFWLIGAKEFGQFMARLNSTDLPEIVTIADGSDVRGYNYVTTASLSSNATRVDWLSGGSLPPNKPNFSFNASWEMERVPLNVPGYLKTFAVYYGSANFSFALSTGTFYSDLKEDDLVPFFSQSYPLPSLEQTNGIGVFSGDRDVQFTVQKISAVSRGFQIRTLDGTNYEQPKGFDLSYVDTQDARDSGGFLVFQIVTSNSSGTKCAIVLVLLLHNLI